MAAEKVDTADENDSPAEEHGSHAFKLDAILNGDDDELDESDAVDKAEGGWDEEAKVDEAVAEGFCIECEGILMPPAVRFIRDTSSSQINPPRSTVRLARTITATSVSLHNTEKARANAMQRRLSLAILRSDRKQMVRVQRKRRQTPPRSR